MEEELIHFIEERIGNLRDKYEVFLIRNEEVVKMSNFADGEGFMPDFILLLKEKIHDKTIASTDCLHYQVFIEPKGDHLKEKDLWKEKFLDELSEVFDENQMMSFESERFRLIGLPFFTNDSAEFRSTFDNLLDP